MAPLPRDSRQPRPRVLLVGTHVAVSRGSRSVGADLAERLGRAGWDVHVTSRRTSRVGRVADMLTTIWRRRATFDVAAVDVYSGAAFRWAEASCALLGRLGRPYVLTLHGGSLPEFAAHHPGRVRALLRGACAVTAPSPFLATALGGFGVDVHVVPNPVDLAAYPSRAPERPGPSLAWVRTLHALYNPLMAVRVVARLAGEWPHLRLTMVGPDKDGSLNRVRAECARLGVADCVELVGGVPKADVPRWMARGDIFLNTTNADNTPVSVIEALACGLCVVSTNVGGIPHLLDDGRDALLVAADDDAAMADAVRRLLRDPALGPAIARAGRAKAERFSWDHVLPMWVDILAAAARSPARG